MAKNKEELIIDLIVQEKGVGTSINALKSFEAQVKATAAWLQSLAKQAGATQNEVASAMNKMSEAGIGNLPSAAVVSTASVKATQAAEASAHSEKMRQIKEEEEAEKLKTAKVKANISEIRAAEKAASAERKAEISAQNAQYDAVFDSYKKKINEILQLTPPSRQTKPLAELAVQMEKINKIPTSETIKRLTGEMGLSRIQAQQLERQVEFVKNGFLGTARAATNLGSIVNTVFGVLISMAVFQAIQLIMNFVSWIGKASEAANNMSKNLLKLRAAEQVISESGGAISPKDFDEMIKKLNEKFILTPKIDIISGLKKLSLDVASLGLGAREIEKLMEAALTFQIQNPDKSLDSIIESMTTPLFGGSYKGAQGLNIKLNDATVKAKALQMGLWDGVGALDAQAKSAAVLEIILDAATSKQEALLDAQDNLVFASDRFNKSWQSFNETFGSVFSPAWNKFLDITAQMLDVYVQRLSGMLDLIKVITPYLLATADLFAKALTTDFQINFDPNKGVVGSITEYLNEQVSKYKEELAGLAEAADTPTGIGEGIFGELDEEDNTSKIENKIQSLIEWLDDLGDKAREMQEDFDRATRQIIYDFEQIEIPRFMEDWELERSRLISETNEDIEQANQEHYDNEYWEYLKFQEKMRQLREKYLFNLEDALRERDARAVLRLGAQYQMDVTSATNEYNLAAAERAAQQQRENEERQRELANRLALLDAERALELKRMKEDFALKMQRREEEHRIDMERLQLEVDEKLQLVADALAEELDLDVDGANAIYNGLKNFYGGSGSIDSLFKYTYENLRNTTKSTYDFIMAYLKAYQDAANKIKQIQQQIYGAGQGQYMPHPGNYGQQGVPSVPQSPTGSTNTQGRYVPTFNGAIEVNLGDGLVASIVEKASNEVGEVVLSVNRARSYVQYK